MYWYEDSAGKHPVVLSTRVRFARNLKHLPFPAGLDAQGRQQVCQAAKEAFESLVCYDFSRLSEAEKGAYVQSHLCSPAFAQSRGEGFQLWLSRDGAVSVMVNEEDHFRIQAICAGLDPQKAFDRALETETALRRHQELAFHPKLGFLTACPTNLGCAMRISAMLHLGALRLTGGIGALVRSADRLGFTLRGAFGEGSGPQGDLYQISNKASYQSSEQELLNHFSTVIAQIADQEQKARQALQKQDALGLEDRIFRSLGTLQSARRMDYAEFVGHWSNLRLGQSLGLVSLKDPALPDRLLVELTGARLCLENGNAQNPAVRDQLRAEKLRQALKEN